MPSPHPLWSASGYITLPFTFIQIPNVRLPLPSFSYHTSTLFISPPVLAHYSATTRYMIYYILSGGFNWVIWYPLLTLHTCFHFLMLEPRSARLSILFIVIRMTPPCMGSRRALHFLAWSFGVALSFHLAQMIWVCETKTAWKVRCFVIFNPRSLTAASQTTPAPQCPLALQVVIGRLISTPSLPSQFVTSIFSDCG